MTGPYAEVARTGPWTWTARLYRRRSYEAFASLRVRGTRTRADRVAARALRRQLARDRAEAATRHEVKP